MSNQRIKNGFAKFRKQLGLQCMVVPWVIWLLIFCYIPMYGIIIAFKDYRVVEGLFGGDWVGFKHFIRFFSDDQAWRAIWNTLGISFFKLIIGFPAPILFALFLNELISVRFKKFVQTVSYLRYFISWVIMANIIRSLFGLQGPVNDLLVQLGLFQEPYSFIGSPNTWWAMIVGTDIWKNIGWNSIIYIAAITGVNPEYYESAIIDGAKRWQRIWYITLPAIMPTVTILLVLTVSGILNSNFDQMYLMNNSATIEVGEVIDTFVYKFGITNSRYSYATAVSLSKSVVSFILLFGANFAVRRASKGEYGLFT